MDEHIMCMLNVLMLYENLISKSNFDYKCNNIYVYVQ